jgi:hypothetical protein
MTKAHASSSLTKGQLTVRYQIRAILVGLVAAMLVAVPVFIAVAYLVIVGAAGGNATWGFGPSTANTEWWAGLFVIGAPCAGILIVFISGLAARRIYIKRLLSR